MFSVIRECIKRLLLSRDCLISRPPGQFFASAFKLRQLRRRGLAVRFAVDGGAATGNWARDFKSVFPDAEVLCIEPRDDAQIGLGTLQRQLQGIHVAKCALGAAINHALLNLHGDQSSLMGNAEGKPFGRKLEIQVRALDGIISDGKFPVPEYIKLDLQGGELRALEGAAECLAHTQALQLELTYLLTYFPSFPEGHAVDRRYV